jgi:hypothetical protein
VVDRRGGRRDADRQHGLSEERVHEARFAVIELADDDEVEAVLFHLPHEIAVEALLEALRPEAACDVRELLERHRHVELPLTKSFEHLCSLTSRLQSREREGRSPLVT